MTTDPAKPFYQHLVEGAGEDLGSASCLYFDGVGDAADWAEVLHWVKAWFARGGHRPRVVRGRAPGQESRRLSVDALPAMTAERGMPVQLATLAFRPGGGRTVEAAWEPECLVTLQRHAGGVTALAAIADLVPLADLTEALVAALEVFRPAAAYGFYFPQKMSPDAYFHGAGFNPGGRRHGEYSHRDSHRLEAWRNNSRIGVIDRDRRHFLGPEDGLVRDVYPLMVLSRVHLERMVGAISLVTSITSAGIGTLEPIGAQYLWRIPTGQLALAQRLLDDAGITLSGGTHAGPPRAADGEPT